MITYKYFVYNNSGTYNDDPAIYRSIYGIENGGSEYIGCASMLIAKINFLHDNLEIAVRKMYGLRYELDLANKRIEELTNGSTKVEA